MTKTEVKEKVIIILQDDANELTENQILSAIDSAIVNYSIDRPLLKIKDIVGDGGYDYNLPTDWEQSFSQIIAVEFPAGEQEPIYLSQEDYTIYETELNRKFRLIWESATSTQIIRLSYTKKHTLSETPSETTVYDSDFEAVAHLGAAYACKFLSRKFAQVSRSLISADAVDYADKSEVYASRVEELFEDYKRLLQQSKEDLKGVVKIKDLDFPDWEGYYLTHPNRRLT